MNQYCIIVTQTRSTETFIEANSPEEALHIATSEYLSRASDSCKDEWSNANVDIRVNKF